MAVREDHDCAAKVAFDLSGFRYVTATGLYWYRRSWQSVAKRAGGLRCASAHRHLKAGIRHKGPEKRAKSLALFAGPPVGVEPTSPTLQKPFACTAGRGHRG